MIRDVSIFCEILTGSEVHSSKHLPGICRNNFTIQALGSSNSKAAIQRQNDRPTGGRTPALARAISALPAQISGDPFGQHAQDV